LAASAEPPSTALRVRRSPHRSRTIAVVIGPSIAPADVRALSRHARASLAASDAEIVLCDVGALEEPDLAAVDLLARLVVTVRQLGRALQFRRVTQRLADLWCLTGLDLVLPLEGPLGVGVWWEPEEWEEPFGVEEHRHPRDPLA
jgi:hypothetical protein